jgi:photosystem II stability/assembly factor-like uncharacterized protein
VLAFTLVGLPAGPTRTAEPDRPIAVYDQMEWRAIGPYNTSGRVSDVEGVPGDPRVVYVGAASGGVWKSEDGGLTFRPVFDEQPIASIGDIAVAASNPEVVYVGTGEADPTNYVSFGNGVYRSTDGGTTWKHLGLDDTRHISRVLVDPDDSDLVYVGALGNIYDYSQQRGVFRSADGGLSWDKVLYLDDHHGVADLDVDAANPKVLFAGMWHFQRKPWTYTSGSRGGGLFRSLDGGDTWQQLTNGLPELMGRIGVKVAPSNPRVVYVIAESKAGTLFRSDDRGETFLTVSDDLDIVSFGLYYTDLRVDPSDEDRIYVLNFQLYLSTDGGKSFEVISQTTHCDYHAMWIDPLDPQRIWQGQDGGIAVSWNRGGTWGPVRALPIAQAYGVFVDNKEPFYSVGVGLQDNGVWYGPSRSRDPEGILPFDWKMIHGGDGFFVVPHPTREGLFISDYQAGGLLRTDMAHRQIKDICPQPVRNDGGPVEDLEYRFNWSAPIVVSPHDPMTLYFCGNVVFKTVDFGDSWKVISPDLTTDDPDKQKAAGGPIWTENITGDYHCTIISFAESAAAPGLLWAGTDDGNLQLSRDAGASWTNLTGNIPGLPPLSPVSHVEPSSSEPGAAFVSFDRHMYNDLSPYIFRTTDFGATWTRLGRSLPEQAYIWVLHQDPRNPNLIYTGSELGLYASYDSGDSWQRLHLSNLPTVAVHDILVHPRENDLILGTHGRGIWIFDDATPLQQLEEVKAGKLFLFPVRPALKFISRPVHYALGDGLYCGPNPPAGALITYYLRDKPPVTDDHSGGVRVEIVDQAGDTIRTIADPGQEAGLNRVAWDLRHDPPRSRRDDGADGDMFFGPALGPEVPPGVYTVRVSVGDRQVESSVEVGLDPMVDLTGEELEANYLMMLQLSRWQSALNDCLRGFDSLKAQLAARRQTITGRPKQISESLEPQWAAFAGSIDDRVKGMVRVRSEPVWSQGLKIVERVAELRANLEYYYGAPTPTQYDHFVKLEKELHETIASVNDFFAEAVPTFNAALIQYEIPPLVQPKPIAAASLVISASVLTN